MNNRSPKEEFGQILTNLEDIKKRVDSNSKRIEEIDEDVTYLTELINRYLKKIEKIKQTDFIIVNALFFVTGFLLGFAIALLIFKG